MTPLHPTLWRTCRVLANPRRLRMLEVVISEDGPTVSEVARRCGVPLSAATLGLRALQARGLIQAKRESRFVYYRPQADPLVEHAGSVLAAMRAAFRRGDKADEIVAAATAFTHVRRILVVRALRAGPLSATALSRRCVISLPALGRHLDKLARRGLVAEDPATCLWRLVTPPSRLAREFLSLACSD